MGFHLLSGNRRASPRRTRKTRSYRGFHLAQDQRHDKSFFCFYFLKKEKLRVNTAFSAFSAVRPYPKTEPRVDADERKD